MLNRFAMLAAVCVALPVVVSPLAMADPPPPPDPAVVPVNATNPLPPEGAASRRPLREFLTLPTAGTSR